VQFPLLLAIMVIATVVSLIWKHATLPHLAVQAVWFGVVFVLYLRFLRKRESWNRILLALLTLPIGTILLFTTPVQNFIDRKNRLTPLQA